MILNANAPVLLMGVENKREVFPIVHSKKRFFLLNGVQNILIIF